MSHGPNLDDPKRYERRPGVPILDVHARGGRVVDEAKLRQVAANSNARAARGELGLLLIGHTTDDGKEVDQPPVVGFVRNYAMGAHDGRPCIMADLFYDKDRPEAFQYPRRSVEVLYSDQVPADNFIDAVALLRRMPERPLGLVSYSAGHRQKERYALGLDTSDAPADAPRDDGHELITRRDVQAQVDAMMGKVLAMTVTAADGPALADFMSRNGITDVAEGVTRFLAERSGGADAGGDPTEFGKDDVEGVARYAAAAGIRCNDTASFAGVIERYKADKRAGKLGPVATRPGATAPSPSTGPDAFTKEDIPKMERYCRARKIDVHSSPHAYSAAMQGYKKARNEGTLDRP